MRQIRFAAQGLAFATMTAIGSASAADFSAIPSGNYSEDPTHSYITLTYSHLGLSNPKLQFDEFDIDLALDKDDPTQSTVSVTIQVDSLQAGSDIFYEHLSGGDFFDMSNYPTITFNSTSVEEERDGTFKVDGELTIKGETKPMSMSVTINNAMMHPMQGKPVIGLDASGMLLRSEFGMGKYTPHVGDEVTLSVTSELMAAE